MDSSIKLELTHNNVIPGESTLVGAKISVKDTFDMKDSTDLGHPDIYYIFIDVGNKVTQYQRSMEYLIASRIKNSLSQNADLNIIRFSKNMDSIDINTPPGKFANAKVKNSRSKIFPVMTKLYNDLKFGQVKSTVIILSRGKVSDARKTKKALIRGNITLPDSCRLYVLGVGKRRNSKFMSELANRLKGKYMAIENINDIYSSLLDMGIHEQPVANSHNGKVLIAVDTHMPDRRIKISNNIIKSIWARLSEDMPVEMISMNRNPVTIFNGVKGFNDPPSINKKSHSSNGMAKIITNKPGNDHSIDTLFVISGGHIKLKKTIKAIVNNKIDISNNIDTIVLKAGKRKDTYPGLMELTNSLGGMAYEIRNIDDMDSFMRIKPINFEKGITIKFPDSFRIAKMNNIYFPLYKDKVVRLKENINDLSKKYIIYSIFDVPPDDMQYNDNIEITYNINPTSTLSKKINITMPKSFVVKMDDKLASEMNYHDLINRLDTEMNFESEINAVKHTGDMVDKYMEEAGIKLFEHKMADIIAEKLSSRSNMMIVINKHDIQKAIMSAIKENYFGSRVIIFSNNENYRSVTIRGKSNNVFAFTISQELLDNIKPYDLRDINRTANMLVTEIVSFMGNFSTRTANLAIIYDFYDLINKLVKPYSSGTMVNMFIDALVEAFEPWNMKILFITSNNNSDMDKLLQNVTTINMAFDWSEENLYNPVDTVKKILAKAHVVYTEGPGWISANGTILSTDQTENMDVYKITGDEIQRIINKVRITFPAIDGIREFLFTAMAPDDPIVWSYQLASQMGVEFTYNGDTIIVNGARITRKKPEKFREPDIIYIDDEWNAMRTVGSKVEIDNAKMLISDIMRSESSTTTIKG